MYNQEVPSLEIAAILINAVPHTCAYTVGNDGLCVQSCTREGVSVVLPPLTRARVEYQLYRIELERAYRAAGVANG